MQLKISHRNLCRIIAFALFWALYAAGCVCSAQESGGREIVKQAPTARSRERIIKTIIGEAAGEGERGMQAVGEVIRRQPTLRPFKAAKRRDLDRFVKREGPGVWKKAESAWVKSERSNITKDATHFENVQQYGMPHYAKRMKLTAKIGRHWFWKE